jgi:hypothetical protein
MFFLETFILKSRLTQIKYKYSDFKIYKYTDSGVFGEEAVSLFYSMRNNR